MLDAMQDLRHDIRERRLDVLMGRNAARMHRAAASASGVVPPPALGGALPGVSGSGVGGPGGTRGPPGSRRGTRGRRRNAAEFRDRLVDYQGNMRDMVQDFQSNRRDILQDLHGV